MGSVVLSICICSMVLYWMRLLVYVDGMVIPFAYEFICIGAGGYRMSDGYMLKSVVERMPPRWTPV